jgi:hypothetical protein
VARAWDQHAPAFSWLANGVHFGVPSWLAKANESFRSGETADGAERWCWGLKFRRCLGTPTYMRAPGIATGTYAVEVSMDELAYELRWILCSCGW